MKHLGQMFNLKNDKRLGAERESLGNGLRQNNGFFRRREDAVDDEKLGR